MGDHSSDKKHRRSHSSRDKHQQRSSRGQVPVSRPYAPPSKDRASAGRSGQAWPPPGYKPSRRRSMRLWTVGGALKTLAFGLLAVACMGGGWYVMRTMVGTGSPATSPEVAQGKSELPDSKGKGEAPKPVDSPKPEIKPPEIKAPEIKPPEIKPPAPEIKPPAPETSVKPEPKPEPKPETKPEPKPEPKPTPPDATVPVVFLDKDIMPIFTIKCNRCHGDGQIKGKLDMRTMAAMLKGGASGPALVPGDLKKSSIFVEIDGKEPSMPPKGEPKLTDEEKKKIEDWIKGGAREKAGAAVAGEPKPAPPAGGAVLAFEKDVLPILEKSCKDCHGAVGGKADLNITTLAFLKRGGTGGPAVVPLSLEKSILWEKISTNQMPPEGKGEPLTKIEKDTIQKWIMMGAKDNKEAMVK